MGVRQLARDAPCSYLKKAWDLQLSHRSPSGGPPPLLRWSRDTGKESLDPKQGQGGCRGRDAKGPGQQRQRNDTQMPEAGCLAGRRKGCHIVHLLLDFVYASEGL